jgi:hypothetical protein
MFVRADDVGRIEHRLTKWIQENLPGRRVFATGSLRFWYNAWYDGQMVGGGSEQGMLNQYTEAAMWVVIEDPEVPHKLAWLKAFGADAVVVHGKQSEEKYHDFRKPELFQGAMEPIYDSGEGDIIYRVPRRYPALARVLETAKLDGLPKMPLPGNTQIVEQYVEALENGPDVEPRVEWLSPQRLRVRARVGAGQSILVQETWDPAWRATAADGTPVPLREGILQYMRLDPPPGDQDILLEFTTPLENKIGYVLTALSLLGVAVLSPVARRPRFARRSKVLF